MTPNAEKRITPEHRSREAIVYVRQSSQKQVDVNVESTRYQINLRENAIALGWGHPRVIDDDLGVSAAGYAHRPGFQQLVTGVSMGAVGIILCIDASRLSRNSKDWAHLLELCGYFDTLIADLDQVYDLSNANDRLVLGIKGTVAEMELNILRTRMRTGLEAKAARGELKMNLPAGYVHDEQDGIVFDPDKRVQSAIRLMFKQFDRCTSVRQLAMWYRDTRTSFPLKRPGQQPHTVWQIPTAKTLKKLLVHPIYTGAYVWGRRTTRVEFVDGQLIKRHGDPRPADQAPVCIRDHHPAYISWNRLLANMDKVAQNRPRWKMDDNMTAIRDGAALLAGLLRCADCGERIQVNYRRQGTALYYCDGGHAKGAKRCMSFGSSQIDKRVSDELCAALQPLGIQAAIEAQRQSKQQCADLMESLRLQVEAAQYAADRAFVQFDLVDPNKRHVADNLEARLNQRLGDLQAAKQRLAEAQQQQPSLTRAQLQRLGDLAEDFATAWQHPQADPKLKKQLLRAAICEILVADQRENNRLQVTIHWHGGVHTRILVKRLQRRARGGPADADLVEMVRKLAEAGIADGEVARILNMQGATTARGLRWTQDRVTSFRRSHRIKRARASEPGVYFTQNQAMEYLGISHNGMLALEREGAISRNQVVRYAHWRIPREQLDSPRVQALVKALKQTGRVPRGGSPGAQLPLLDGE